MSAMRVPPVVPFFIIIISGHLGLEPKTGARSGTSSPRPPESGPYFMARVAPLPVKALGVVLDG